MIRVTRLAIDERADLLAVLRELTPEQWLAPSLCSGWSVRDVVAHVIDYDVAGWPNTLRRLRSAAFDLDRANAMGEALNAHRHPDELIRRLAQRLKPRGLTSLFGSRIALLDTMIHHQDIRRPLGLPRIVPAERLVPALDFARVAYAAGIPRRIRGLSFHAVDLDWRGGRGPLVTGPA